LALLRIRQVVTIRTAKTSLAVVVYEIPEIYRWFMAGKRMLETQAVGLSHEVPGYSGKSGFLRRSGMVYQSFFLSQRGLIE
jgi:hypothetical protein